MNKNPFFSVIIPTYQSEDSILRAITSVLMQEHTDLEVLVIDDGSTDHTSKIITSISDNRIKYRHIQHMGTQYARYEGVKCAQGMYIVFLDSDDELMPHALESIYLCINLHPCDIYIGGMQIKKDGVEILVMNQELSEGYCKRNTLFQQMTDERHMKTLARKVVRREIARYHDPFIQEHNMTHGEDMFFSLDMLIEAERIYVSHEIIYIYHQHANSTMHRFFIGKYKDRILMSRAILHYGELLGISQGELDRIAGVYLTKGLVDCLLEVNQAETSLILEQDRVQIENEILNLLREYAAVIRKNQDRYLEVQIDTFRRYKIC